MEQLYNSSAWLKFRRSSIYVVAGKHTHGFCAYYINTTPVCLHNFLVAYNDHHQEMDGTLYFSEDFCVARYCRHGEISGTTLAGLKLDRWILSIITRCFDPNPGVFVSGDLHTRQALLYML